MVHLFNAYYLMVLNNLSLKHDPVFRVIAKNEAGVNETLKFRYLWIKCWNTDKKMWRNLSVTYCNKEKKRLCENSR